MFFGVINFKCCDLRWHVQNMTKTTPYPWDVEHWNELLSFLSFSFWCVEVETVWEDQLVPGDVIIVPSSGCVMTCDTVLVAGNCIVNESALTGEKSYSWYCSIIDTQQNVTCFNLHVALNGIEVFMTIWFLKALLLPVFAIIMVLGSFVFFASDGHDSMDQESCPRWLDRQV